MTASEEPTAESEVEIGIKGTRLLGNLSIPRDAGGLVIFAHGSGSSRLSTRNMQVARTLRKRNLATLLFDLLTPREEAERANVFDIDLLSDRLVAVTRWAEANAETNDLPLGYFGASTGAAAALYAAAEIGTGIRAVKAPTLLIVGGADQAVLALNEQAASLLRCPHEIAIVPGATHLFEEPGTLERVAELAGDWLVRYMSAES